MKLLVIFTGGTIGSSLKEGWISPDGNAKKQLIAQYQRLDDSVELVPLSLYEILSENLSAKRLNMLIDCIAREEEKDYDGIVVTHGTDTLQYSAAALDYASKKRLPILLVSAAFPLDDKRSNGLDNFAAAVRFLKEKPQAGVYVAYKNEGEERVNIHLATRLTAHAEGDANLYSLDAPYATLDRATDTFSFAYPTPPKREGLGKITLCEKPPVLLIESRPELSYRYDLEGIKAVLLSPYHSGTLNTESEDFVAFCQKCKQNGVPVCLINAPKGETYSSAKAYADLGILPLPACPKIAAFVKCWIAVSLNKEVKDFLLCPLANEFI